MGNGRDTPSEFNIVVEKVLLMGWLCKDSIVCHSSANVDVDVDIDVSVVSARIYSSNQMMTNQRIIMIMRCVVVELQRFRRQDTIC